MPRRPAKVTQADIARAIRAAKEAGASEVVVDGSQIRISLLRPSSPKESYDTAAQLPEWELSAAAKPAENHPCRLKGT
jgi:hypothetical protein